VPEPDIDVAQADTNLLRQRRLPGAHRRLRPENPMAKKAPAHPELGANARTAIIDALTQAMAETAVTQQKAQNFHWNVEGMAFGSLHDLFGKIYTEHFAAQDELAERVKALGGHAEGRLSEYLKRSNVKESDGKVSDKEMLKELRDDQRRLSRTMRALEEVSSEHGDAVTADMATNRAEAHDKFAWMLDAHIGTR
jgi:starvation-inducible DNA-binding protein